MTPTHISTHPKYDTSGAVRRMAERHKEKNLDKAIKTIQRFSVDNAERVAEALMEADGIPRHIEDMADLVKKLNDDFHEMFPDSGDAA